MAALLVARCDGSEVFKTVDGALDDIAPFVSLGVESWRRATTVAFAQPAFSCVQPLRANTSHAALLDLLSIMTCPISTVHTQASWPLAWASSSEARHADGIEHRADLRRVAALPGRDQDRQRQAVPVDAQMDFAGDATA